MEFIDAYSRLSRQYHSIVLVCGTQKLSPLKCFRKDESPQRQASQRSPID